MAVTLVSYWAHDETGTGTRADSHTGGNTLTNNGAVTNTTGARNNGSSFSGSNHLSRADNASLSGGDTDFGVSTWFRIEDTSANRVLMGKWGGGLDQSYLLYFSTSDSKVYFAISGSGSFHQVGTPSTISISTDYHITAYHDSVNDLIALAINDGTLQTVAHSTGANDGGSDFVIGVNTGAGPGEYWNGMIDESFFFNGVPTSGELTAWYGGGTAPGYAALFGGGGGTAVPVFLNHLMNQG